MMVEMDAGRINALLQQVEHHRDAVLSATESNDNWLGTTSNSRHHRYSGIGQLLS
ncbi:hypothetical protein [Puia sp.]|uniref:hypothetical protein n=1 Tax=Puia sp. TaxID=2045100 RepID=UPI002D7F5C0B|nr:hypothetical protein [Puia sp.]